jgi:hypothetical protein
MKLKVWESDTGSIVAYWEYDTHSEDHGLLAIKARNQYDGSMIPADWLCEREMESLANTINTLIDAPEEEK